jgi:hypothetical protein
MRSISLFRTDHYRADDRGRRARTSAVSQPSTVGDLVQIALAVLQPRSPRVEVQQTESFARIAVLQAIAVLCAVAALCCGLGALWIYAGPTLGAAGALCAVSVVRCAVGLSAFAFERRARESRVRSSVPDLGTDALLAGRSSFFHQHTTLTLIAALFAGVLLDGEY